MDIIFQKNRFESVKNVVESAMFSLILLGGLIVFLYFCNILYRQIMFQDWREKSKGLVIRNKLFWEYDMSRFDWQELKVLVMQRILERGHVEDWYAVIALYGGRENVREILKNIPIMSAKDLNFVCVEFNLKKEELKCYTYRQLREKRLDS